MAWNGERVSAFGASALVFAPVVIGGVTYYRIDPAVFLPWTDAGFVWREVRWAPRLSHLAVDPGPPPVAAATIGAATAGLAPARMCIWPVATGSIVIATANLAAVNMPIILGPGDSVDLDGHSGDLLVSEGPQGSAAQEPWDWTNGAQQALLGPSCFQVRVSQLNAAEAGVRFTGDASFSAQTLSGTLGYAILGSQQATAAATDAAAAAARPSEVVPTAALTVALLTRRG